MKKAIPTILFLLLMLMNMTPAYCEEGSLPISIGTEVLKSPDAALNIESVWSNGNGNYVYFGEYEQGSGVEPIKWRVLENSDKVFLLSDKVLDQAIYDKNDDEISWENSDIRAWLNGDFADTAFSDIEKGCIVESYKEEGEEFASVRNPALTGEKVFLLSGEEVDTSSYGFFEVNNMLYTNESTKVDATPYAVSQGVYCEDNAANWLTRSPSGNGITYVGGGKNGGWLGRDSASNKTMGVVPAINIGSDSIAFVTKENYNKDHLLEPVDVDNNDLNASFDLTLNASKGFEAKIKKNVLLKEEKPTISVTALPEEYNEIGYTQISAMLIDSEDAIVAYGRISDEVQLGDISFDMPRGLALGDYDLIVFAEKLNSSSAKNAVDIASNFSRIKITIQDEEEAIDKLSPSEQNGNYGNMEVGNAIEIAEADTKVSFMTRLEDDAWDQTRWYKFTPKKSATYEFTISDALYVGSENDTYLLLYSSLKDAKNSENYEYEDLEGHHDTVILSSYLIAGQTYYLNLEICSDYGFDKEINMNLNIKSVSSGHIHSIQTVSKGATCQETGIKKHYECTVCHKMFKDAKGTKELTKKQIKKLAIKKKKHNFKEKSGEYLKSAATCTKPAYYYYTCKMCHQKGKKSYKSSKALGHDFVPGSIKKATGKKDGKIASKCSRCGKTNKGVKIPKASKIVVLNKKSIAYVGAGGEKDLIKVVVKKSKYPLNENEYDVSYSEPVYKGKKSKGTVTIKFKPECKYYSGTMTLTYKITKVQKK